jgi:hypothetical protein
MEAGIADHVWSWSRGTGGGVIMHTRDIIAPMASPPSLQDLGDRLAKLLDDLPDNEGIVDVFDFLAGAVYSLKRMDGLSVWGRKNQPRLPNYKAQVSSYLSTIPNGKEPKQVWISGYFLNSALQRIAACYDRIPKLILSSGKCKKGNVEDRMKSFLADPKSVTTWRDVYKEVNALKHDREGIAAGRSVANNEAILALAEIVSTLEDAGPRLKKLSPKIKA